MLITILCSIIAALIGAAIQHQITSKTAFEEGEAHGWRACRNRMFETMHDQAHQLEAQPTVAPIISARLDRHESRIIAKANRIREEHAQASQSLTIAH